MKFLALNIARKYLFAKKSHNVINLISAISVIAMSIGTAVLILVLSIYNGFNLIIEKNLNSYSPDILITAESGQVFDANSPWIDSLSKMPEIRAINPILEKRLYLSYENKDIIALAKGVDESYVQNCPIEKHIYGNKKLALYKGEIPLATVGLGLARQLDLNPNFLAQLSLVFPSRTRDLNEENLIANLNSIEVQPHALFSISQDVDNQLVILPLDVMQELLEYENMISGVELRLRDSLQVKSFKKRLVRLLPLWQKNSGQKGQGETASEKAREETVDRRAGSETELAATNFVLKDRYEQNEHIFKMLKYEKLAIIFILVLIVIIIASNILGSISMLYHEKEQDIAILKALGASDKLIDRIFILVSFLISLLGLVIGIIIAVAFCFIQEQFALISMPLGFGLQAYPIVLEWADLLVVSLIISIVGFLIAYVPVKYKIGIL